MSLPPFLSRSAQAIRRTAGRARPGHLVALSAVAVAALGLAGLRAVDLPGPRPIADGDRMRIEVVPPVEPELIAGSTMEVGELVDGFDGVPPARPAYTDVSWADDGYGDDADDGWAAPAPPERHRAEVRTYDSRPEPERASPARMVQRWFGFDAPRPDYQAERAARRARLEAMELDARRRQDWERRRYERAEQDRYAAERRRDEARAPRWREDRRRSDDPRDAGWRDVPRRDEAPRDAWRDDDQPARDDGPRPYESRPSDRESVDGWNG
ncbi:MAG: hypothetical protein KKG14_01095 [Alphaproteobacteria bacterium]|nr:hypothetical protein [Alphaproteobacteria bacterium]MBU2272125.1 hypothetical protein [Alphaproteobacteria bacterium]MBU2417285.1 hypothetical protein [Alphaproteobacteria bacterium]